MIIATFDDRQFKYDNNLKNKNKYCGYFYKVNNLFYYKD